MFTKKEIQDIAYRIKYQCRGCPDSISYHDLKDQFTYDSDLKDYFFNKANRSYLFENEDLSFSLIEILNSLETIYDDYDRRRVALYHGMIQSASLTSKSSLSNLKSKLDGYDISSEDTQFAYIFLNALMDKVTPNNDLNFRINLQRISNRFEGNDETESLFNQFKTLVGLSVNQIKVSDNSIQGGNYGSIPTKEALKILFDFDDYDFQDYEFVGGARKIGRTSPMSLRKKMILAKLDELRSMSIDDAISFFE